MRRGIEQNKLRHNAKRVILCLQLSGKMNVLEAKNNQIDQTVLE